MRAAVHRLARNWRPGLLPQALAEYFVGASKACRANSSAAACYAGMGGHVMGGAYEEEPPQVRHVYSVGFVIIIEVKAILAGR